MTEGRPPENEEPHRRSNNRIEHTRPNPDEQHRTLLGDALMSSLRGIVH